ncbi:hypothetical protein D023_0817 [Vibrio parahaemolyticus 3256]|nr:hypothetical protein D022_0291 [Vibrio parahaemolyticus 12310]ETT22503.1 hypothetical protein D023_0817 [Vibrio parahaemolyticus 3256]EVU19042.1 hypothetical protein D046_1820 [Vibrio parahaemolyticus V-223/04]
MDTQQSNIFQPIVFLATIPQSPVMSKSIAIPVARSATE